MAKLSMTHFAAVITLFGLVSVGHGFKQELWLYTSFGEGASIYIDGNIPDLADFNTILPKVVRICTRGIWGSYDKVNYETYYYNLGDLSSDVVCLNRTASALKSVRHWGAGNTTTNAVSLYTEAYQVGKEIFVAGMARTDISDKIVSLAATGTSKWTLFEGVQLDGNSTCITVPTDGPFTFQEIANYNLSTVGSVFRSCDMSKILTYKLENKML